MTKDSLPSDEWMVFDLETTGLDRNPEILQIASSQQNSIVCLERYLLPDTRTIADSPTQVHGITVQYRDGAKIIKTLRNVWHG